MAELYSSKYQDILADALELSPAERLSMIEKLAGSFRGEGDLFYEQISAKTEMTLTEEEITDYMRVEPLSPSEISEHGLLGTWRDLDISDGSEWVNNHKRSRKERGSWSMRS